MGAGKSRLDKDGLRPTARDPYLQSLIEKSIYPCLSKKSVALDLGCGDAISTIKFAAYAKRIIGVDFSKSLLGIARRNVEKTKKTNITLLHNDIRNLSGREFKNINTIISIRCLISLASLKSQQGVLDRIAEILPKGGYFLCAEGFKQGIEALNRRRQKAGLKRMTTARYNRFFDRDKFEKFTQREFDIIAFKGIGLYLYLSRVVYPALIFPDEPRHNNYFNKVFAGLQLAEEGKQFEDYSYTGLYILRKR